jgi:uncharacterized protein YrrD
MPVVSLEEGVKVGRVTGLVVDPALKAVTALVVEKRGLSREQKFVPFLQIYSIGANAITLNRSQSAVKGASLPEILRLYKEKMTLIGAKVIVENGTVLGSVIEYRLDTATGLITTIEIAPTKRAAFFQGIKMLDTAFVRTIGRDIVVVTDSADTHLDTVDEGLKERATHAWEEVKSKGQKLGRTITTKSKSLRRTGESKKQSEEQTRHTVNDPGQSNNFDTDRSS